MIRVLSYSIFLSFIILLSSCRQALDGGFSTLEINHAEIKNGIVRLLLSEVVYSGDDDFLKPHQTKRQFILQRLYVSEPIVLDGLLRGIEDHVEFSYVATLNNRSHRNYFSALDSTIVLMVRKNSSSAGCDNVVPNTPCRNNSKLQPLPQNPQGTLDFNGMYRFSMNQGVAVYTVGDSGELGDQPFAELSFELVLKKENQMSLVAVSH